MWVLSLCSLVSHVFIVILIDNIMKFIKKKKILTYLPFFFTIRVDSTEVVTLASIIISYRQR